MWLVTIRHFSRVHPHEGLYLVFRQFSLLLKAKVEFGRAVQLTRRVTNVAEERVLDG